MMLPLSSLVRFQQIFSCITDIIHNSTDSSSTVIQAGEKVVLDIPTIHRSYRGNPAIYLPRSTEFFLIYNDEIPLKRFISISKREIFFNPRCRLLVIGNNFKSSDIDALLFDYMFNVIFLSTSTRGIFTYFPYESGNLQNTSKDLRKIGSCDSSGFVLADGYDSLYPEKIPVIWKDSKISLFYNYEPPLAIGTEQKKKGIEIELYDIILDRIKIAGNFVLVNNSFAIAEKLLTERTFDVFFGNVGSQSVGPHDFTISYLSDSAYWFVPQQALIPKWKCALRAFSKKVWVLWSFSAICSSLFWYTVYKVMENKAHPKRFLEKLWIILRLVLEQSMRFKTKYISQSFSLFLVIQSMFVLNIVYRGKYTYFLSGTNYEMQLNSLEDIMRNNLNMGSTEYLIQFFLSKPEMRTYLKSHFVICDTGITCLNRSLTENMAILKPYRKVSYIRHLFRDRNGRTLHHRIPKSVMPLWQASMFRKGHPVFPLVNRYFHFLMDHGFLAKITNEYDHDAAKYRKLTGRITKRRKFSFEYFVAPFFILTCGIFSGLFALAIEVFMEKMKNGCKIRFIMK